jgi:hypothetical protein
MRVENAKIKPQILYGLHMAVGVAEYREPGAEPYRIFVGEEAIKSMDPTFQGCPVYVSHVDEVDLENIQEEADGFVIRSFYNAIDGKHWSEFIVVSDRGHEAIRQGWKLSNAYLPTEFKGSGIWHGVDYAKEVVRGEYEHLAIVPNPRYAESVILTPEEFKAYNGQKEIELKRLANSKEKEGVFKMGLKFFQKKTVENAQVADLENMSVMLPKSKREMTIAQIVNQADELVVNEDKPKMANGTDMVKCNEEDMTVASMLENYGKMASELEELKKKKENDGKGDEESEGEKQNTEDEEVENETD